MMVAAKTAYFRCDASSSIGMGHIMRCFTLAKALKNIGWSIFFISDMDTDYNFSILKSEGIGIYPADYQPKNADLLIVDHYGLDKDFHTHSRRWAESIMVIDDLANRQCDCDILLDQTYGREVTDYKNLVPEKSVLLCGQDYILLRQGFLTLQKQALEKRQKIDRVENILINFGSTNPDKLIQKSLESLARFSQWSLKINIVCGSIAEDLEAISDMVQEIQSTTNHRPKLHIDINNMEDYILVADLAIGAGGTTSWERAALGLPTLLIEVSQDQSLLSQNLEKQGAIKYLGRSADITGAAIDKAFQSMRDNSQILRQMSQKCFEICDGQGVSQVLKVIEVIVKNNEDN